MVIALDIGTSSTRAAVYDELGRPIEGRFHQVRCAPTITPDGGVEHDPATLLDAVAACLDAVLAGRGAQNIAAIGVSTFWHGLLGFDASDRPLTPVYLWADTRSAEDAALLRGALDDDHVHARTGCHLHSSYWPAKLRWLARTRPTDAARVTRWGSFGEYLELRLFGEAATSVSMASATGLLDQDRVTWDPEALAASGIEPTALFPIADRRDARYELRAPWSSRWPTLRGAAWLPAIGDGAASNIGSGAVDPRRIALNVGTSAALRVVGTSASAPRGLWRYRIDRTTPIVGGATSEGGNVYAWCFETLKLPSAEAIDAALTGAGAGAAALTVLPFLAGERAPGWRDDRRGAIAGLGLDTSPVHILRAMLDAVAMRLALIYDLLAPCAAPDHVIVGSGGALKHSAAWFQIITDAIGRPITQLADAEASGRGAALLALHALGRLGSLADAPVPSGQVFEPDPARHLQFRDALARQQALDDRV
jgi:gluconokinase